MLLPLTYIDVHEKQFSTVDKSKQMLLCNYVISYSEMLLKLYLILQFGIYKEIFRGLIQL